AEAEIIKAQAEVEKAKMSLQSFQYRAEGDMAKRDTVIEQGLNKSEDNMSQAAMQGIQAANEAEAADRDVAAQQQANEEKEMSAIEAMVKKLVAETVANTI
ncbi:MAG: hypothetical protein OXD01_12855, partial [Gammaproteobacteria bacterium]|nr:hypothetical protein [Gammaproteobacteria bacterium]